MTVRDLEAQATRLKPERSTRARGTKAERELEKLIEATGWRVRRQPNSGAAHGGFRSRRGDLRISCGEADFTVEAKLRKERPAMLQALADGAEVLAIKGGGEWLIGLTPGAFEWFLTMAAEHTRARGRR
jgi:Holliday junction resolvase